MRSISVRLSVTIAFVVIGALGVAGVFVAHREVQVVQELVLRDASSLAVAGAAGYSRILDDAVDSGKLAIDDITQPKLEEIKYAFDVSDKRYRSKLSDYTDSHGVQAFEDALLESCDGCLFASGMRRGGYVPTTNAKQDLAPTGDVDRDRRVARGKRVYDGAEQLAAAGFTGGQKAPVLIQTYPRDTGELAWDVAAPIFVHGQHFGAFRIGVSQDRINAQWVDLLWRLSVSFGFVAGVTVLAIFLATRARLRRLVTLTAAANHMSQSYEALAEAIPVDDGTELGLLARALNRLRVSLKAAMDYADRPRTNREG
ncbi:MAG TPA: HAMP domain-containing protein [Mycobacterium sp.]|nr:HAMP domain-containing protein [Mycobacterium sp.]